jgi:hypothetical protein
MRTGSRNTRMGTAAAFEIRPDEDVPRQTAAGHRHSATYSEMAHTAMTHATRVSMTQTTYPDGDAKYRRERNECILIQTQSRSSTENRHVSILARLHTGRVIGRRPHLELDHVGDRTGEAAKFV